jgi:capsular exopolysaccharide synthesis family protein
MSRVFEATRRAIVLPDDRTLSFETGEAAFEKVSTPREVEPEARGEQGTGISSPVLQDRTVPIRPFGPSQLLPFNSQNPWAAERYRILRTRIVHHPRQVRILCVSSTSPGDGKSVTAINLADSLALKSETRVLLVDVDLRRPQLANFLGIPGNPGLTDLLSGERTEAETIVRIERFPNLYFLPSGRSIRNPAELLDSEQWRKTAENFRNEFDYTVIDSPPIGPVADYDLIETVCEGVILVVRPGHSNRLLLQKGLDQMNDKFMGVVINCAEDWFLWRTHDGSRYYQYSDESRE